MVVTVVEYRLIKNASAAHWFAGVPLHLHHLHNKVMLRIDDDAWMAEQTPSCLIHQGPHHVIYRARAVLGGYERIAGLLRTIHDDPSFRLSYSEHRINLAWLPDTTIGRSPFTYRIEFLSPRPALQVVARPRAAPYPHLLLKKPLATTIADRGNHPNPLGPSTSDCIIAEIIEHFGPARGD